MLCMYIHISVGGSHVPQQPKMEAMFRRNPDGTVTRMPGDVQFASVLTDELRGRVPGIYGMTRPSTTPNKRSMQNLYHEKAKAGFKYWYQERPKPTSCKLFSMHKAVFR